MSVDPTPVLQTPAYFTYKTHHYHCKNCPWQGLGSELHQGELFNELFELDCPSCSEISSSSRLQKFRRITFNLPADPGDWAHIRAAA